MVEQPQQVQYVVVQKAPTSELAVASLVFGIIGMLGGFCLFGIPSFIAVGLGHLAMEQDIKKQGKSGNGMAIAGLITGYLVAMPWVLFGFFICLGALMQWVESW